jgi:hypothetical protein
MVPQAVHVMLLARKYDCVVAIPAERKMNIDCRFDYNHTKCGLFTKFKLTKYEKIIHCLYWILAVTRKKNH